MGRFAALALVLATGCAVDPTTVPRSFTHDGATWTLYFYEGPIGGEIEQPDGGVLIWDGFGYIELIAARDGVALTKDDGAAARSVAKAYCESRGLTFTTDAETGRGGFSPGQGWLFNGACYK